MAIRFSRTPFTPLYGDVLRYLQRRPVSGTTGSGIFSNYNAANNPYLTDFNNTGITNTKTAAPMIAPIMQATGGGGSVYSLADARTSDDYNPYAYRESRPDLFYDLNNPNEMSAIGRKKLPGIMGAAVDFIESKLPVNPRAILENELLGKGFAIDDIGRIVGDPNTAEGIMAGYNAAKVTSKTFDKRRDAIMKGLMKTNPEAARERLALLDEAEANMLGARNMTKDILSDRYGEIDKYQFTGPNVQGDFYTSIKDDEDDEDENYYDYDYESFGPRGPAGQNLYVQRGLQAAEAERQRIILEDAAREKAAAEAAKREAERRLKQQMESQNISRQEAQRQNEAIREDQQRDRNRDRASQEKNNTGYDRGNYCFDPNTLIQMVDGSKKKIKEIQLGDQTKGGEVTGVFQFKASDEIHDYKGVTVAGSHYVKEDGKFIMVKDSPISVKIDKIPVVYSLDTTGRRIFINNIEFADYNGDGIAKGFLANAGVDLTGFDKEVLRQVENRLI